MNNNKLATDVSSTSEDETETDNNEDTKRTEMTKIMKYLRDNKKDI